MPEKPITQKIIKIAKDADRLIQDVEKGARRIFAGVRDLKELGGKSEGEKKE